MNIQSHCLPALSPAEPLLPIGSPSVHLLSLPASDSSSGVTSHISSQISQGDDYGHAATIGMLPDNVLLEIFDFYRIHDEALLQLARKARLQPVWKWHLLVHVCRRWRQIIFESPHRLNLQILCTDRTPVRKKLGIWPAFPIVIDFSYPWNIFVTLEKEDSDVAALEHPNRICRAELTVLDWQFVKMLKMMLKPFPVLTYLHIISVGESAQVLPANFLGGSAPSLQEITLSGIPFPTLPTFLSSTSALVMLDLRRIPPISYISPEAMVASLAALPRLETFSITFRSATSRPDRVHPPPATRTVLPSLTSFQFGGASEYLEDLICRVDSPQLDRIHIHYLDCRVGFQVAQLSNFIHRSIGPKTILSRCADVAFVTGTVTFYVYGHVNHPFPDGLRAGTFITYDWADWQVSHVVQVLRQLSTIVSNVVHLKLEAYSHQIQGTDDVEWLDLLHLFPTVQTLHVSRVLAWRIVPILENITGETVAEVLPSLDLIYLAGKSASSIEKFIAVCQLSGRPVTAIHTESEIYRRLHSYVGE